MQLTSKWRHLTEDGKQYIFKRTTSAGVVNFVVSDMVRVWVSHNTEGDILLIFKELNPLIEFNDETIVMNIWSIVDAFTETDKQEDCSLRIALMEEGSLQLKFLTKIDGHTLKFNLRLNQGTPDTFFKEVFSPTLAAAEELLARQDVLCSLLHKKDEEIKQYQLEGASLSRRIVQTQIFNKADFLNSQHFLKEGNSPHIVDIVNLQFERDQLSRKDAIQIVESTHSKEEPDEPVAHIDKSELDIDTLDCKQDAKPKVEATVLKLSQKKRPKLNL